MAMSSATSKWGMYQDLDPCVPNRGSVGGPWQVGVPNRTETFWRSLAAEQKQKQNEQAWEERPGRAISKCTQHISWETQKY